MNSYSCRNSCPVPDQEFTGIGKAIITTGQDRNSCSILNSCKIPETLIKSIN
jgi:hypothetical protein